MSAPLIGLTDVPLRQLGDGALLSSWRLLHYFEQVEKMSNGCHELLCQLSTYPTIRRLHKASTDDRAQFPDIIPKQKEFQLNIFVVYVFITLVSV